MSSQLRNYSPLDKLCMSADQVVRTIMGTTSTSGREYPAVNEAEADLSNEERKHAAGLMRVNHAGEVCAQALYHGQSIASRNLEVREQMQHAAVEEGDHLAWCHQRLVELGSHTSYLNPLWYVGSFVIGLSAGLVGDKWSLGFVAETENQVVKHLETHVNLLPAQDKKSLLILNQMRKDESQHHDTAMASGAAELPSLIKTIMRFTSKFMVKSAYWL